MTRLISMWYSPFWMKCETRNRSESFRHPTMWTNGSVCASDPLNISHYPIKCPDPTNSLKMSNCVCWLAGHRALYLHHRWLKKKNRVNILNKYVEYLCTIVTKLDHERQQERVSKQHAYRRNKIIKSQDIYSQSPNSILARHNRSRLLYT